MDAGKISRLREEQQKAVTETDEQIKQFQKFKSDYQTLQTRLRTLPDKLSHDVMVPFGKLAFMPGQLVHTNEVLVLLGDNWFAERSAKQASDIASRRIKELNKRIQELKEQQKLLEPRLDVTSQMQAQAEGKGDYEEIIEEYAEDKERQWDEQHKVNVRRHHKKLSKLRASGVGENSIGADTRKPSLNTGSDEDIWSRLDALEIQEEERGELNSSFESDTGRHEERGSDKDSEDSDEPDRVASSSDKKVNWLDEKGDRNRQDNDEDSDDDDDEGNNDSDEVEDTGKPVIRTITFSHSKTPAMQSNPYQVADAGPEGTSSITSPGDIYRLFSPKPILKKTPVTADPADSASPGPDSKGDHLPDTVKFKTYSGVRNDMTAGSLGDTAVIDTSREKAFSGIVKETPTPEPTPPPPSSGASTTQGQQKRVSKFKATRMGQKPSM